MHGLVAVICVLVGCFFLGLCVGIVLFCLPRFGTAVTGAVTGAIFGMQIYGVACCIKGNAGPEWFLDTMLIVMSVLGIFLGALLRNYFFMLTTSYLGAFLLVRGFGNLVGNYPNVMYMTNGEVIPKIYFIYVGSILGVAIVGYLIQIMLNKKFGGGEDEAQFTDDRNKALNDGDEIQGTGENQANNGKESQIQGDVEVNEEANEV